MKERIVIVFIAITLGLLITTLGFFLYQQTKITPLKNPKQAGANPTPTPANSLYLTVEEPQNEKLTTTRSIQIKGVTNPENKVIVSTNQEDVAGTPTSDGHFAITITIDAGSNEIITRSLSPNGEEKQDTRVLTYSSEDF